MPGASHPSALDIDRSRSMAREISFESSELSTPCSLASQSTADISLQDSIMSETDNVLEPSINSEYPSEFSLNISQLTSRPPLNFGTVIPGKLYRSSYPLPENFGYLAELKLKTILTLVPQPIADAYARFMRQNDIRHIQLNVPANKEQVEISQVTIGAALSIMLDPTAYPMLIHCNKGKHRTGCLVACLRKWQGMLVDDALIEYHSFAYPKARLFDELFIKVFDKDYLLQFAQKNSFNRIEDSEEQHTGSPDTMVTGGQMNGKSLDELQSMTNLRTMHLCPKILGS